MENYGEKIRTFIAVSFSGDAAMFFQELQARLKGAKIRASFPEPSTIHLTLKFLGDIQASMVPEICQCISGTVLKFKKEVTSDNKDNPCEIITLWSGGLGVFPSIARPKIIWAGVHGQTNRLEKLHDLLDLALNRIGFKREKRGFTPHFTLARIKKKINPEKIMDIVRDSAGLKSGKLMCSSIVFYRSKLTPAGAVHTELFSWPLVPT